MPATLRKLYGRPRPHLLFLHVEKTGGSSVECATQGHDMFHHGIFTNLGHTKKPVVDRCRQACMHDGAPAKAVISIREPYAWWRSMYTYSYVCHEAPVCTKEHSLAGFLRECERHIAQNWPSMAQSAYIERECGRPCNADHHLRTERLQDDWLDLLRQLHLPLVGLPRVNPTVASEERELPPVVFTQEAVDIIHRLDANMFAEFGYRQRTDTPFEL